MNLANKSFKNNITGEIITVIDSFENIAILENKQKVDVRKLLDPSQYTEQIDVKSFFDNQNAYNSLAEKIKTIPTDNLVDDNRGNMVVQNGIEIPPVSESAIIMSDPEQEKLELARKYGATIDNASSTQKQNEAFAKILGSEEELPKTQISVNNKEQIETHREYHQPPTQRIDVSDPVTQMFRNVKRNVGFKMNIEISNKIPRIDFIEMMEDSYEVSIIDYLAEEFTQNLLKDPSQIKEMIKDKIKKAVYGAEIKQEETKTESNESSPKKKATRKPKKESIKND